MADDDGLCGGAWTIDVSGSRAGPGRRALAVEIDPRVRRVSLVWRTVGLGDAEVGGRAIFRQFLEVAESDPAPGGAWLAGPGAGALLARIARGYAGAMTWSGDPVGTWSPDAWAAAEELVKQICTHRDEDPAP